MKGQTSPRRDPGAPRIPADIRSSAVEKHLAKSKAMGGSRLRRSKARRRACYDWLVKQEPPPPPPTARCAGAARGERPKPPFEAQPTTSPWPRPLAIRRCFSADEVSIHSGYSQVSAGSLLDAALRLEQQERRETGKLVQVHGPGPTPRAEEELPKLPSQAPPTLVLPRPRISTIRRCFTSHDIASTRFGSKEQQMSTAPVNLAAALPPEQQEDRDEVECGKDEGRCSTPRVRRRCPSPSLTRRVWESASPRGGGDKSNTRGNGSNGRRVNDHSRAAWTEMVDDFPSSAGGVETVAAPVPTTTITIDTTNTTRGQPTAITETRREVIDVTSQNATVSGIEASSRAVAAAVRSARAAAVAAERREKEVQHRLEGLRKLAGNSLCADCSAPCADWASVAYGSFVCLNCAGQHRSLGMHVTYARSLTLAKWTERNLRMMEAGGNLRLAEFTRRIKLYPWSTIEDKYAHPCFPLYQKHIAALADGLYPLPISREALEKAVQTASGEEAPDDGNDHDGRSSGDLDSNQDVKTTSVQLRNLVKSISGGCGGLGDALLRWSCQQKFAGLASPGGRRGMGRAAAAGAGPEDPARAAEGGGEAPRWIPDDEVEACMLCQRKFTFVLRRHHCRRCGRLTCIFCAPTDNTRPIIEWGFIHAVRHCRLCYRSPLVEWSDRPNDLRSVSSEETPLPASS